MLLIQSRAHRNLFLFLMSSGVAFFDLYIPSLSTTLNMSSSPRVKNLHFRMRIKTQISNPAQKNPFWSQSYPSPALFILSPCPVSFNCRYANFFSFLEYSGLPPGQSTFHFFWVTCSYPFFVLSIFHSFMVTLFLNSLMWEKNLQRNRCSIITSWFSSVCTFTEGSQSKLSWVP